MGNIYSSKIIKIETVAQNTLKVSFERPSNFYFQAGQYIQLAIEKLHYSDPKGQSRVFSICSPPLEEKTISIVFRETGSGFKKTLAELSPGSAVFIEGPLGFFALPELKEGHHIFIAGGIGIAPFMSMISHSIGINSTSHIQLIYANRDVNTAAFVNELHKLDKLSNTFSFDLVSGRLELRHFEKCLKNTQDTHWWIVGPPNMVTDIKYMIESLGVWGNKIHIEEFTGY